MTEYQRGWDNGVQRAAYVLQGKANELRGLGNGTTALMARVFEEQVDAIMALRKSGHDGQGFDRSNGVLMAE